MSFCSCGTPALVWGSTTASNVQSTMSPMRPSNHTGSQKYINGGVVRSSSPRTLRKRQIVLRGSGGLLRRGVRLQGKRLLQKHRRPPSLSKHDVAFNCASGFLGARFLFREYYFTYPNRVEDALQHSLKSTLLPRLLISYVSLARSPPLLPVYPSACCSRVL